MYTATPPLPRLLTAASGILDLVAHRGWRLCTDGGFRSSVLPRIRAGMQCETFWLWLRLLPWMLVLPASALANNEVLKKVKFLTFCNAFFNAPLKI